MHSNGEDANPDTESVHLTVSKRFKGPNCEKRDFEAYKNSSRQVNEGSYSMLSPIVQVVRVYEYAL